MRRGIIALVGIAAALSLTVTGSLLADGGKGKKKSPKAAKIITVPGGAVLPEGIAARGKSIYTGSSADGTIYRAPARAGSTAVELSAGGADGRTAALGMKFDKRGHLLVAGGGTGKVFVLDRSTGATLGIFSRPAGGAYAPGGPTFLNDIAIAKNGDAYVTDSFAAVIYRIPAAGLAAPTMSGALEEWLLLEGSPIVYQNGFNLNGIVARKKYLLTVQTNTGKLFRIKIGTKQIAKVKVRGTSLIGGDGMILDDEKLYVVHAGVVDVLKLKSSLTSVKKLRKTIKDPSFDSPTTAALHKGRLFVVNSQFGRIGGPNPPAAPFTISVLNPNGGRH